MNTFLTEYLTDYSHKLYEYSKYENRRLKCDNGDVVRVHVEFTRGIL